MVGIRKFVQLFPEKEERESSTLLESEKMTELG